MNKENKEMFSKVKQKAYSQNAHYKDERLDELAALINEQEHKTLFLGSINVKDRRDETHNFHGFFLEWVGQAVVGIKGLSPEVCYTFIDFSTDPKGNAVEVQGVYAGGMQQKTIEYERFKGQMYAVVREGDETSPRTQQSVTKILTECLGAKFNPSS